MNTNKIQTKKNKIQRRYIYRFLCTGLLCFIAVCMFMLVWYQFVRKNNNTGYLLGLGNLGMAAGIYAILYYIVGKGLRAFKIGVDRKANLLASQVMTIFMVDFFELFISCGPRRDAT